MEDNLQRVFTILISVIIFFMLPLYISFEKKDDISYGLALKITSNFVNNVTSKGYITNQMYNEFVSNLSATGNVYDVKLEHVAKKYYPVIYQYNTTYTDITGKTDYILHPERLKEAQNILSYGLAEERFSEKEIIEPLGGRTAENFINSYKGMNIKDIPLIPNIYNKDANTYTMNVGDEFNVIIKNTNVTIATVLFNTLTFGVDTGNNTRVYINYGGTIENEDYRENLINMIDTTPAAEHTENTGGIVSTTLQKGDANGDHLVDIKDLNTIENYLKGKVNLTGANYIAADYNNDGVVDIADSGELRKKVNEAKLNIVIATERIPGDANGDKIVSYEDAYVVQGHVARDLTLSGINFENADINKDGTVSSVDALLIQTKIAEGR
ncbi:MAG: dockerin type I repeat-containing protein [Clostridia bacterium]